MSALFALGENCIIWSGDAMCLWLLYVEYYRPQCSHQIGARLSVCQRHRLVEIIRSSQARGRSCEQRIGENDGGDGASARDAG
jgi:hypothetical protein